MTGLLDTVFALVFAPGVFTSEPVWTAAAVGGAAAVVSGVVGVLTVIRGQSFAGHALADVSSAGGAAAVLVGVGPLAGFLLMAVIAATGMEVFRVERVRERDLVTGIMLGAGLGVTALLLHLDMRSGGAGAGAGAAAAVTVMFGSMFAIPASTVVPAVLVGVGALGVTALLYRPLLLCSVDAELAAVGGVQVRLVGYAHLVVLALAVSLSALTVGAILSTALLIGPAAIALRIVRRPGWALAAAAGIGLGVTWGGILMAYDSYVWTGGHPWPVSFCVVALIFAAYAGSGWVGRGR